MSKVLNSVVLQQKTTFIDKTSFNFNDQHILNDRNNKQCKQYKTLCQK